MKKPLPKFMAHVFPTVTNILWIGLFFAVLIYGRRMMNVDGDLALHLNLGKYILAAGRIPLQDVFSHTMSGQPVMQHEWLTCVIFDFAFRMLDFGGIILISALLISTTFWLVFKRTRDRSPMLVISVSIVLYVILLSMVHWLTRPHLFTFLLLNLWMIVLHQLYQGKVKHWWLLPVLMLLWVNLHGGFIAGFLTWFVYGVGVLYQVVLDQNAMDPALAPYFWRYYLMGGGTALLASLINPSGVGLWIGIISHLGNKFLADITREFQSPNFHEMYFWPFLIFIGLLVIVLGVTKKRSDSGLLFTSAAWLLMGLYSARNIPLFGIVVAPLLAGGVDEIFAKVLLRFKWMSRLEGINERVQNLESQLKGIFWPVLSIVIAVVGLVLGFRFDSKGLGYGFAPEVFPVEAVNWLMDNPQDGEMFNKFTWGGYLQYRLWPDKRVFIDSKSDFYGEDFVRQYLKVIDLEKGWEDVLDQYQVQWAILPADEAAALAIEADLGWDSIYEDATAVILRRD